MSFQNLGKGGRQLREGDLLSYLSRSKIQRDATTDTVILALGGNDGILSIPLEVSREMLSAYIAEIERRKLEVICVSPTDNRVFQNGDGNGFESYKAMMEELCPVTLHASEWIDPDLHMYDFAHFNEAGHKRYALGMFWSLLKLRASR